MPAGHPSRPDAETGGRPPMVLSGRYRLDAVLGQGGVGTVWRARDLQLGRDVAVKQLQPGVARDPVAADRFRREATTAASLAHASLVTIYDVGEDDGAVYLVMELVEGPSLKHLLAAEGPLEPGEVAALGHRVATALGTVHARGLVHRDIKPGNVLLPVDGPPKLVDFGTVHVVGDGTSALTTPGTMMGTIGYVAPEQFEGHAVDPRADVYAVGLLMHECLTGEPTFGTGTIAELTRRRLAEDAEPPSRRRAGIPPELDEIVVRATLRDPEQRFTDGRALAAALAPLVPADADARLRALARQHAPSAVAAPTTGTEPREQYEATTVLPRSAPVDDRTDDLDDTGPVTPVAVPHDGAPDGGDVDATSVLPATLDDTPAPHGAPAPPPATTDAGGTRRRGLLALAGLAVVAVVAAALGLGAIDGGGGDGEPDGSGDGGPTPVAVAGHGDLDPHGDDEHPEDVPRAFDGDPSTRWQTQLYNNASLDKPGVGMWVQAAEGSAPRRAEIDLAIPGATVEVYALQAPPEGDPSGSGEPVATAQDAEGTITAELPEGTTVVVVWFTSAGPDAGRHRAGVSEIRLSE